MCSSKIKSGRTAAVAQIDGRPVLQPACNRVAALEAGRALKKSLQKPVPSSPNYPVSTATNTAADAATVTAATVTAAKASLSPPVAPKPVKRGNDPNSLNSSTEKPVTPTTATRSTPALRKKSKKSSGGGQGAAAAVDFPGLGDSAPGSIAAAQREQTILMQAQRKMRIAHYGRTATKLEGKVASVDTADEAAAAAAASQEEKRCSFITPNSDPLCIAYHDQEWGVPVHDDKMLFELLVLTGAQVGLDWTSILKKRNDFRAAFAGFDAQVVAGFTERQIAAASAGCGLDLGKVRGVVDNSNRILEVRRAFGSLDKYLWGFVNHKPIATNYKSGRKMPSKTSKSESISKDLVRRGFRSVGPTVVHSFMQAAGFTNDHLISCPRHLHCSSAAAH